MKNRLNFWKPLVIFVVCVNLILLLACQKKELPESTPTDRPGWRASRPQGEEGRGQGQGVMRKKQGWRWQEQRVHLTDKERETVEVRTVPVERQRIRPYLSAVGKVLAPYTKTSLISYAFPARVVRLHRQTGEWVKEKEALITLQSEEVGRAKADFFKATADLELAKRNYERQKKLFERGAGAQKDLLLAEAEFKVAEANLAATEKKLHVLGFSEEEVRLIAETHQINPVITLYSPISGKIVGIKVVPGEMVDQNKEIMTILDPTVLWVDADIFEKDMAKIRIGQEVEISVQAYPEKIFSGRVSYIGDVLKEETRTVTVRTEVINKGLYLKPGMFATAKIYLHEEQAVLVVPEEAVLDDQGNKFVFVRQDNSFLPRKVTLGAKQNGLYEILDGLNEGEEVVTEGSYALKSKLGRGFLKEAGLH